MCLHYYAHLSIPELSVALNCSQAAARKRVERGVQCLRDRLAQRGLVLTALALISILGAPAQAAVSAETASTSTVSTVQCLEKWQSLLHSSVTPTLSGVAKIGVIAIMTKYIVGAVALLALLLGGVQTYQLNAMSKELLQANAMSANALLLQDKIETLEKSLTARNQDVDRLNQAIQERPPAASLPVVAFEGLADKPNPAIPNGIAPAQKFNPVGLWRKQDGAFLRLNVDGTLDFIDSKGTWNIVEDKLILEFEKWGHKEISLVDNNTIDDGESVFSRITFNMPVADKNLRPNFANPTDTTPGQKEMVMKYLGGGIIQYQAPDGQSVIVDGTQMFMQYRDKKEKGQSTQPGVAPSPEQPPRENGGSASRRRLSCPKPPDETTGFLETTWAAGRQWKGFLFAALTRLELGTIRGGLNDHATCADGRWIRLVMRVFQRHIRLTLRGV